MLGPLRVSDPVGERVTLGSQPQRRLLSMLVMRANSVVPADTLQDVLGLSSGALRTSVSRLRRLLGDDVLVTAAPGYELRARTVDAVRFEHLLASARTADGATSRALFEEALSLWQGEAYAEFADEEWARVEVARLTELRVTAVEELVERLVIDGEHGSAIARLEPLVDEHPYRERPRSLLMRALAMSGRQTEALRHFQAFRRLLIEEVGTEPSPALVELDRAIASSPDGELIDLRPVGDQLHRRAGAADAPGDGHSIGTFVFAEVVASAPLWATDPDAMDADLELHDRLLRATFRDHGGAPFETGDDHFAAAFGDVDDAVAAAMAAQVAMSDAAWRSEAGCSTRIAIHSGAAERRGAGWYGPSVLEGEHMAAVAHGGQIVVSEAVAARLSRTKLIDLGEHRLRDVDGVRRLFQVTGPDLPSEFPPLRSLGGYRASLPVQRTSFIGRAELLGRIHELVEARPLVTLVGPGGSGKTRVAIEAAGRELPHFSDGVFLVDLSSATSDAGVVDALLSGLDLSLDPGQDREAGVVDHLRDRSVLLLLDNCEHVRARAGDVADAVLRVAPRVRILATSREPLGLEGEQCLPVPPLDVEGPASTAARLFEDRALTADPSLGLDDGARQAVGSIVRRLDGMPLAIELAAARVRSFTPAEIVEHLDQRFRLLRDRHTRAVPRQRTLEAAIDWSYDLLDDDEQRAFRRLSICAGAFTMQLAGALLEVDELDAAELLESLVAKSLVNPVRLGETGRGYRFLETLRVYGRDKLEGLGETIVARVALERALLPPSDVVGDWTWLANTYLADADSSTVVEDTTRREAADVALQEGRFDAAALIYSSCAFRDDPGSLEAVLRSTGPLTDGRHELSPLAWRAANATRVALARLTRRYDECFEVAERMYHELDRDDPARPWFGAWRAALTIAVAPEAGLLFAERVLDDAIRLGRPGNDGTVAEMATSMATGLALTGRLDEARKRIELALEWSTVGGSHHDQALGSLLWLMVVDGGVPSPEIRASLARQDHAIGLAEFCAGPAAICAGGPVEDRADALCEVARRRPTDAVATPYLLAFAWLALEQGDTDRAKRLAEVSELYDSSTQIGLLHLLARLEGWTDETWRERRDATIARYLSPDHQSAAERGPAVLDEEIERWS